MRADAPAAAAQVFPKCGDGVDFSVILSPVGGGPVQYLHEADYELSDKPTRQRLHFYLDKLETGDVIDFTVYPRGQHDCDGALLLEAQIWEQEAYKARPRAETLHAMALVCAALVLGLVL